MEGLGNLQYYLDQNVLITLKDGSEIAGILIDYNETQLVLEDNSVELSSVADIYYHDTIDLDDYTLKLDRITFPNGYIVTVGELEGVAGADFATGEQILEYKCHLVYDVLAQKIRMTDMVCINISHAVNIPVLAEKPHLYRINNGPYFYAELTDGNLVTPNETIPFDPNVITDITRCPESNETVLIILESGEEYTSTIVTVTSRGIVLAEGYSGRITFDKIKNIRYSDKCNTRVNQDGKKVYYYGNFRFRGRYLKNGADMAYKNGQEASFAVGMTSRGLVAKDIDVSSFDFRKVGYGVVFSFENNANFGTVYNGINDDQPVGDKYFFSGAALPFGVSHLEMDTHRNIYAIEFKYVKLDNYECPTVTEMRVIETFNKSSYRSVYVDNTGNISAVPKEPGESTEDTVEEGYGFINFCRYIKPNCNLFVSKKFDFRQIESNFFIRTRAHLARFRGADLDTKNSIYLIHYWFDKKDVPESGKLQPIYKFEILESYPKNRSYYIDDQGKVQDFNTSQFENLDPLLNCKVAIICKDSNRYLGYLLQNDEENSTLTLSSSVGRGSTTTFNYSDIIDVLGIGNVQSFNDIFGFIRVGNGIYFAEQNVDSDKLPKVSPDDLVSFKIDRDREGRYAAKQVRPLVSYEETGYIIDPPQNGFYEVLNEKEYKTVSRHKIRESVHLKPLLPKFSLANLDTTDYLVTTENYYYLDGSPLVFGIDGVRESIPKLHFGFVSKFCTDNANNFTFGFITEVSKDGPIGDGTYFHVSQNSNALTVINSESANPNRNNKWMVSYNIGKDNHNNRSCAVNMTFFERMPESYFSTEAVLANQRLRSQQEAPLKAIIAASDSIQSKINACLKHNNIELAVETLNNYKTSPEFNPDQFLWLNYSIYDKNYKLNHTGEARKILADCISALRTSVDNTEHYGKRLDLIFKQAHLCVDDGKADDARSLFAEWSQLLEEYTSIYPGKKVSYEKHIEHIRKLLSSLDNNLTADSLDAEEKNELEHGENRKESHPYIEWRMDNAKTGLLPQKSDNVWKRVIEYESGSEVLFTEALISALRHEKKIALNNNFSQKTQLFAHLTLLISPKSDATLLKEYFCESLNHNNILTSVLFDKEPGGEIEVKPETCSKFTSDSVLLFATTSLNPRQWLSRFQNDLLRERYIRELCLLVRKNPAQIINFDNQSLDTFFEEAVLAFKNHIDSSLPINEYADALRRKLMHYRSCGMPIPYEITEILSNLKDYNTRTGFTAKMDCLRSNATRLQEYYRTIQRSPSTQDWNFIWPICMRLISQIQRCWHNLCSASVPSIRFGTVTAVPEENGSWLITLPMRNSKNAQEATELVINDFEASSKNPDSLLGDDIERAFNFRITPESEETEQMSVSVNVSYKFISDIEFKNDQYQFITKPHTVSHTFTVSCFEGERAELSGDILKALGGNAKNSIDTSNPVGKIVAEIFKNRTTEIEEIISSVSIGKKGERTLLKDGRWVALYGPWRVGKTTIIHEVFRALKEPEFKDQAIPVYALFSAGNDFENDTVDDIHTAIKEALTGEKEAEIFNRISKEFEDAEGSIPSLKALGRFIGKLHNELGGKCIVLAIDEFTSIYRAIKKGYTDTGFLRNFIDFINDSRCIILTAGGEHTVSLMMDYDVNMMQKADHKMEVKYLSRDDTDKYLEAVITVPSYFGSPEQKERTCKRIFELTQGNVFLLLQFCKELIAYVNVNKTLILIDDTTIQRTLDRIANSDPAHPINTMKTYFNSLFNPFNEQDSDPIEGFDNVKQINLRILNGIVAHAFQDTHACLVSDLKADFNDSDNFDMHLQTLINRSVVEKDGNNLRIPIDMYYEIQSRFIKKEG